MEQDAYVEANRANWNDRVAIHLASRSYDVEGFLAGRSSLSEVDLREVGDVQGKTLLHLQCHFGMDTLSWARAGARVTGVDFAPAAIEAAHTLATRAGLEARFLEANVYDAAAALAGERFDVVFTGVGALCWLPDITAWARVAGTLVKPGGFLYVREGHPVLWALDAERTDGALVLAYPYFEMAQPTGWNDGVTYTDNPAGLAVEHVHSYEWNHGLGEIVTALIDAGMQIDFVHEWDTCDWQALPWMVPVEDASGRETAAEYSSGRRWRLPDGRERVPLMYSLRAHKDAGAQRG